MIIVFFSLILSNSVVLAVKCGEILDNYCRWFLAAVVPVLRSTEFVVMETTLVFELNFRFIWFWILLMFTLFGIDLYLLLLVDLSASRPG
jgi:hypothetical protein